MTKVKCYSVRLESLVSVSEKAYKATAFDGSSAIIPKSQLFGLDYDVQKSDAYWISAWILEQKQLQYSPKKVSYFDKELSHAPGNGVEIERHIPEYIPPAENGINPADELVRDTIPIVKTYRELKRSLQGDGQESGTVEGWIIFNGQTLFVRKHWSYEGGYPCYSNETTNTDIGELFAVTASARVYKTVDSQVIYDFDLELR